MPTRNFYGQLFWKQPLALFTASTLLAVGYLAAAENFYPKPATLTEDVMRLEEDTYNLPGGLHRFHRRIDVNDLNYSIHSHKYWPKWDRRDDDDDNLFHLATIGKLGGAGEEEEEEE